MPAVAPLPPATIRQLLEAKGYALIAEDQYNWAFARGADDEPVLVPKAVDLVPLEIAFAVAQKVGFDLYIDAVYAQSDPWPDSPSAKQGPPTTH